MPMTQSKLEVREQKVVDVMHRGCIKIKSDAPLTEAIRKMKDAGVSSLIVEPRWQGDAYGILTRKDIVEKAVGAGPRRLNFSEHKVFELMTKPLVTVPPGLKVKYAIRLMERERVRRLPVFNGEDVIGILSNTDVFKRLAGNDRLEARHRPR